MNMKEIADIEVKKAREYNIYINDWLKADYAGIYAYFFINEYGAECCFYVGKAYSFYHCLFGDKGQIRRFLKYKETNGELYSKDPLIIGIDRILEAGHRIEVRCLEPVDYHDEYFGRAASRLAFAHLYWLRKYQEKGMCLNQWPDGVDSDEEHYWNCTYCDIEQCK